MARDDDRDGERTLKLFAATLLLCAAIGIAFRPDAWYVPFAFVGALLALAVAGVAVGRLWELLRRCPRCGRRGFTTVLESARDTPAGDREFQIDHCRRCGLYRLESGAEVRELDPDRWEEQLREWLGGPPS